MDIAHTRKTNLHIAPELWRALKIRAIEEGITATEALNRAIADYLKKPMPKAPKKGR